MEECTSAHTLFICSLVQTAGWFAKLKTIVEIALFDSIVIEDCCFFCNFMVSYSILIYTFVSMNYKLITWFNLYCFVAGFRYWWHVLFLFFFGLQGARFEWYEKETSILCRPSLALTEEKPSCLYHLHYRFWPVPFLCDCVPTLDDRYFTSSSLQFCYRVAHVQAWQVPFK